MIHHYHDKAHHQGRLITLGAVPTAGFWIIGASRMVAKILNNCVSCRKLRGRFLAQHMADLPSERTEAPPPFINVGFDVFGPCTIYIKWARGGTVDSKRWGLVFTCLSSCTIHTEVLEEMDSSSFISALRSFLSIRSPVSKLWCDCGTNFI